MYLYVRLLASERFYFGKCGKMWENMEKSAVFWRILSNTGNTAQVDMAGFGSMLH